MNYLLASDKILTRNKLFHERKEKKRTLDLSTEYAFVLTAVAEGRSKRRKEKGNEGGKKGMTTLHSLLKRLYNIYGEATSVVSKIPPPLSLLYFSS